jgi:Fe-S cluster assembly protein SufB
MTSSNQINDLATQEYKYGFVADLASDDAPRGLNEDIIRHFLQEGEPEWLLEWRLKAYRHWLTMTEPTWQTSNIRPSTTRHHLLFSAEGPR